MSTRDQQLQAFLDRSPFARFLGVKFETDGEKLTTILPFQDKFIGNKAINAMHGGCTGAFLALIGAAGLCAVGHLHIARLAHCLGRCGQSLFEQFERRVVSLGHRTHLASHGAVAKPDRSTASRLIRPPAP